MVYIFFLFTQIWIQNILLIFNINTFNINIFINLSQIFIE